MTARSVAVGAEACALGWMKDELTIVEMAGFKEEAPTGGAEDFEGEGPAEMGEGVDTVGIAGITPGRRGAGTKRSWGL